MIRSANRVLAPAALPHAEARLALTEFLLSSDDLVQCAERALDWLARKGNVKQSICLTVERRDNKLVAVASRGVAPARVAGFALDLDAREHPLVAALTAREPLYFHSGPRQPRSPLERTGYHAIPLRARADADELSPGLLLASAQAAPLDGDVRWLADVLGEKLSRLRTVDTRAEALFAPERALLYGIINAVTDPILLTDLEGRLIVANARAEKLFAAPDDASEGRRRAVTLNNMLFSAALASHAVDSAEFRRELLLVDPTEGSDLLFELLSTPVKDAGPTGGVVSILRNVTDLGRAMAEIQENYQKLRLVEAEVRAERHRLDLIIDSVADPIVVSDANGDITLMNTPAEKLFLLGTGTRVEEQRRVRANEAHFSSFVAGLMASGRDLRWKGEMLLTDPSSGASMPVEAVAGKILSEQGELQAVVTILHDRTEALEKARLFEKVKQASRELEAKVQAATAELAQQNELLRRQHIELEQASALKTQFLANMSHEFRTPLNAILGYTFMMLQGVSGQLSQAQRKNLLRIDSNGRHLLALINDILDISRIEAGRMPLHLSEFRVPELVAEVMSELEPMIARSRLKVTTERLAKLPVVRSDRKKVKQILVNLLSNALKFTHEGGIRVSGRHQRSTRTVSIAVVDTGIGIAAADQERVFEDFRQLDNSPTRAYGGTGLGLSICRRLATMLGGRITLESQVGRGSTFTLQLPLRPKRK